MTPTPGPWHTRIAKLEAEVARLRDVQRSDYTVLLDAWRDRGEKVPGVEKQSVVQRVITGIHELKEERDAALASAEAAERSLAKERYAHGHTLKQRDGLHADLAAERERADAAMAAIEGVTRARDRWTQTAEELRQRAEQAEQERDAGVELLTEEQQRHAETQRALIIANTTQANLHSVITAKKYAIVELERDFAAVQRKAVEAEAALAAEREERVKETRLHDEALVLALKRAYDAEEAHARTREKLDEAFQYIERLVAPVDVGGGPTAAEWAKRCGTLSEIPVDWRHAALRIGEALAGTGPDGYYDFTPSQWAEWALTRIDAWRQREEGR